MQGGWKYGLWNRGCDVGGCEVVSLNAACSAAPEQWPHTSLQKKHTAMQKVHSVEEQ